MIIVLDGSDFVSRFGHFLRFLSIGFVVGFLSQVVNASMHHFFLGWTGLVLLRFLVSIVGLLVAVHLSVFVTCSKDRFSGIDGFSLGTVGWMVSTLLANYHPGDSSPPFHLVLGGSRFF